LKKEYKIYKELFDIEITLVSRKKHQIYYTSAAGATTRRDISNFGVVNLSLSRNVAFVKERTAEGKLCENWRLSLLLSSSALSLCIRN
jgi:hypothetical protein